MDEIKLEVCSLSGAQLNWAVAIALGLKPGWFDYNSHEHTVRIDNKSFDPSGNWADGGPIVEKHWIGFHRNGKLLYRDEEKRWAAHRIPDLDLPPPRTGYDAKGATALIAAMRCFVLSRSGPEVSVPVFLKDGL